MGFAIDGVNCPYCNQWITELDTVPSQSDFVCPNCSKTFIVAKTIEYQDFKSDDQFMFRKNLKQLRSRMNLNRRILPSFLVSLNLQFPLMKTGAINQLWMY
ncbi:MAG: hypothetical protein K0S22_1761 [Oscillospiraceae bacterium]|jgi:transposase-like protein|nr:hypothetical protein [Oscillospiraceae bacterium]